ncbi:MAG: 3-methyladenine glycosylase [Acidimicrobiaceae bacterium]|jgi:DNA-3-methyladenine glycosylase|nr:3-methyladenine glycosylase [Acidimicrobiaceae bacterium]
MSEAASSQLSPVDRRLFLGDSLEVAPRLLNLVLVSGAVSGRIVEVEAYRSADDPASHAYRGQTRRNATMFGPPGHLYVYFTYGMHHCANVVCGPDGTATAVLLRALTPLTGFDEMRSRRPRLRRDVDLCAGPGRLCAALAIDLGKDGADLVLGGGGLQLCSDGVLPPEAPLVGPRIGLSERVGPAAGWPWRFAVPGEPCVSKPVTPRHGRP